jgi:flavin reductase (DIM6/NTAB) family NADH-FMN oxidoreductase RutF
MVVPRYVTVGERDPQQRVRVMLHGLGPALDVTRGHVVAAMRPLTVAMVLPAPAAAIATGRRARLVFTPWDDPRTRLGVLTLAHDRERSADGVTLQLFRVERHTAACMPWWTAAIYALSHAWAERRHRPTFRMSRRDRWAFEVLYICPRPVVLVSVAHHGASNMFPMDLIGPMGGAAFLLALRSTSLSVALMQGSARLAVADVPLEQAAVATGLAHRHPTVGPESDGVPFETIPSPAHGLRVPRWALRVRDLEVRDAREVGSHTLFVTRVVREERRAEGLQMCTVSGPCDRWLRLRGVRLPRATVAGAG